MSRLSHSVMDSKCAFPHNNIEKLTTYNKSTLPQHRHVYNTVNWFVSDDHHDSHITTTTTPAAAITCATALTQLMPPDRIYLLCSQTNNNTNTLPHYWIHHQKISIIYSKNHLKNHYSAREYRKKFERQRHQPPSRKCSSKHLQRFSLPRSMHSADHEISIHSLMTTTDDQSICFY